MAQETATNPQSFTAVSVALSLQTSGAPTVTNPNFSLPALGLQASNSYSPGALSCVDAYQITGVISPSNYTGAIYLRHTIVATTDYKDPGGAITINEQNVDDTSLSALETIKSGSVYDLDGPAENLQSGTPVGTILRLRANFDEYAVLGASTSTTKVSTNDVLFFTRLSCRQVSTSIALDTTYPSDNQIGLGSTKLTDNLQ